MCLGLVVSSAGAASAQSASDVGTWKLNAAKSKYDPGPAPTSGTTTITAKGAVTTIVVDQTMPDGAKRHWESTTQTDGKEAAVSGNNPDADALTRTRVNATTVKTVYKKGGKETTTQTSVVSADGKTRTVTTTGTNAKGQKVHNVAVYEKQ
jgi:hypothetical protein